MSSSTTHNRAVRRMTMLMAALGCSLGMALATPATALASEPVMAAAVGLVPQPAPKPKPTPPSDDDRINALGAKCAQEWIKNKKPGVACAMGGALVVNKFLHPDVAE